MRPFNERLKALREAAGLTQEGLATAARLTVSTISKLEQRADQDPAWSTVVKLAVALGVSVAAFTEDGDERQADGEKGKTAATKRKAKVKGG